MKHLVRCSALVVVLLLLASVGTASAECAWLLWRQDHESFSGEARKSWTIPLSYPDRAACVAAIAGTVKTWEEVRSSNQEVRPASTGTSAEFITRSKNSFVKYALHCFPDTIDPRGPKGK